MGHNRLGKIPTTRQWKSVVELLTSADAGDTSPAADIDAIAKQSMSAVEHALQFAIADDGLKITFFLLTKLAESAKEKDWESALKSLGIETANCKTAAELSFAIQDALDDQIETRSRATDVSEIAKQAAGDALHRLFQNNQLTLFGDEKSTIASAIKTISSKNGYAELGHTFFSQFLSRYLNFYLSRATASAAGGDRFLQTGDISIFNDALQTHCRQSSFVVRDFCGSWYSKTSYKEGINKKNTSVFLKVALNKLSKEMARQGREQ